MKKATGDDGKSRVKRFQANVPPSKAAPSGKGRQATRPSSQTSTRPSSSRKKKSATQDSRKDTRVSNSAKTPKTLPVKDSKVPPALLKAVTQGNLDYPLPLTNKIVRIFTSSTFTDTKVERNALMEEVYPKLKVYCQERGYEFQVVDMRWGVRDEATDDHMTSELCMREIRECQKLSTGPNFITFLAQKYGYRPFPSKIEEAEFNLLLGAVEKTEDKKLLCDWFLKDDNSLPTQYCLQAIRDKLPDYANDENVNEKKKARGLWWEAFEKMQIILRKAASKALTDKSQAHKYYWSVTEEEIQIGLLGSKDPSTSCYWFQRNISDLESNRGSKMARRFMDLSGGKNDDEAGNLITKLKRDLIPSKLPPENITNYKVKWTENGIDPSVSQEHKTYVRRFCDDFQSVLIGMIDKGIERRQQEEIADTLLVECIEHLQFAKTKSQLFLGRDEYLQQVTGMVKTGNNGKPIIFCGQPGCGKTTLMAKIVEQVPHILGQDTPVVARFIGTTSQSSGTRELLQSLCQQIAKLTGKTDDIPKDLKTLKETFVEMITKNNNQEMVVLLDSLDQLRDFGTQLRDWIPESPAKNVTLIMSAIPDEEFKIIPELKQYLPDECFMDIPLLSKTEVESILTASFQKAKRTLQKDQMEIVHMACERCSLPLYMKIAVDTAIGWRSYTPRDNLIIGASVNQIIDLLFERVEKYHGQVPVAHALGCITVARAGLSVNELEDVLSCDDVALNDVYQYHMPPLRRLPPLLWVRIQAELQEYLTNSGADGIQVIRWYHRQFHTVAKQRYLQPDERCKELHEAMVDYFMGTWAGGVEKPYTDKKGNKLEADRHPAQQPLVFKESEEGREEVFNLRKMNELPYHLVKSGQVDALKENVLCCFRWLYEKTRALGIDSVLDDFELAKEHGLDDEEIDAVFDALSCSKDSIVFDIKLLPCQLVSRLAGDDLSSKPFIQKLIDQAKRPHFDCLLTSLGFNRNEEGGGAPLQKKFVGHTDEITVYAINNSGTKMVSVSVDNTIRIWDLNTGRELVCANFDERTHDLHPHFMSGVQFCNNDNWVVIVQATPSITVWDMASKSPVWSERVSSGDNVTGTVCLYVDTTKDRAVTVYNSTKMETWDIQAKKKLFEVPVQAYIELEDSITKTRIKTFLGGLNADVVFHRGGSHQIHFFNIDSYQQNKSLISIDLYKEEDALMGITRMTVTPDGVAVCHYHQQVPLKEMNAMNPTPAFIKTFDIKTGKVLKTIDGLDAGFFSGLEVLVPGGENTVVFTPMLIMNTVLNKIDLTTGKSKNTLSYSFGAYKKAIYAGCANEVLMIFNADPTVIEHLAMTQEMRPAMELKTEEGGALKGPIFHSKRYIGYANGIDSHIEVWDLVKRCPVRHLQTMGSGYGMSYISPYEVLMPQFPNGVLIYNMKDGKESSSLETSDLKGPDQNQRIAPAEDGNFYVVGPKPNEISLYNVKKKKYEYSLKAEAKDRIYGFKVSGNKSTAIAYLFHKMDDQNRVIFPEGHVEERIVAYNLKDKKRLPDIKCKTSTSLAQMSSGYNQQFLTHDGRYFAGVVSTVEGNVKTDTDVLVWETKTGKHRKIPGVKMEDSDYDEVVHIMKYSKASNSIVIGYQSGVIRFWSMADLSLQRELKNLKEMPQKLWLSPDERYGTLSTSKFQNRIHILDFVNQKFLMSFRADKNIDHSGFSEDNKFVLLSMPGVKSIVQLYWYKYAEWKSKAVHSGKSPEDEVCENLARQEKSIYGEFQQFTLIRQKQE